ncbi:MAG: hypothetical protein Q9N68_02315 [Gammaproteobacteria bacterium]|nr:hypothetical protein [Gammaproteobacteria bacterium]
MRTFATAVITLSLSLSPVYAQRILFDASHGQTAGNADWIIDADGSMQSWKNFRCKKGGLHHSAQRYPTPAQSQIKADTPETFWSGGISAWGMALAKDNLNPKRQRNWQIEQYPWNAQPFSYNNANNPQDLMHYDVLVLDEPNVAYNSDEISAIRQFVFEGGGLFLIADHETSDRNCSGGKNAKQDSPAILNALLGNTINTQPRPPYYNANDKKNDYGPFGLWFYENGNDDSKDQNNRDFDWFDEVSNNNINQNPKDPLIHGSFGDGSKGLGLFGSTQIGLSTDKKQGNSKAQGHIWRNGQTQQPNLIGVSQRVTLASSQYGQGRVVALGDSSPSDDSTGQGRLYPGWDQIPSAANHTLILNATDWLARRNSITPPPPLSAGPAVSMSACVATINWQTAHKSASKMSWGEENNLDRNTTVPGLRSNHLITLGGLSPEQTYRYRLELADKRSVEGRFKTVASQALAFQKEPSVSVTRSHGVQIQWQANQSALVSLDYGQKSTDEHHLALGSQQQKQSIELANLTPATPYQLVLKLANACGETLLSKQLNFTTAAITPPPIAPKPNKPATQAKMINISGWRLINNKSRTHLVFPANTSIKSGEYLVIGRNNSQTEFEKAWGKLPNKAHYLNSKNTLVINKSPRRYTLVNLKGELLTPSTVVKEGLSVSSGACSTNGQPHVWDVTKLNKATPGKGAQQCNQGLRISEVSDAKGYRNEFVELYFDAPLK